MVWLLRVWIAFFALVFVFEVAAHIHPPVLSWGLAAIGRSPVCSPGEALVGAQQRSQWGPSEQRIRAASRVLDEDAAGLQLWETPGGHFWIPKGNAAVLPTLLAQQQTAIYGDGERGVRPGEVVLDCGAHVGVYARTALEAGAQVVVAIEPAPNNVECLRRNFRDEIAAGSVIVYPKGVWDREALLPLYEDTSNSAADSFVIRGPNDVVRASIPLTTIDNLVRELNLPRVDVIKMDIKGATERALQGAAQTLAASRPRLILSTEEIEDDARSIAAAVERLGLGYRTSCGTCAVSSDYLVVPVVLFFQSV